MGAISTTPQSSGDWDSPIIRSAGKMARVLITGGAGFIGSHLCESFLKRGDEVLCMDNFSTGAGDNVAAFASHPRFTFAHQDVSRFLRVDGPVDCVLHFASPASPVDYMDLPIQTL